MGIHKSGAQQLYFLQAQADRCQVRLSPQASAFFFKCCAEEGLPRLELVKYVRTRWSSMYDLLERAFKLQMVYFLYLIVVVSHYYQGIIKFIQLADDSSQVPNLQKKTYADFKLSPNEWTNLELLRQILKVSISRANSYCH